MGQGPARIGAGGPPNGGAQATSGVSKQGVAHHGEHTVANLDPRCQLRGTGGADPGDHVVEEGHRVLAQGVPSRAVASNELAHDDCGAGRIALDKVDERAGEALELCGEVGLDLTGGDQALGQALKGLGDHGCIEQRLRGKVVQQRGPANARGLGDI